MSVTIRQEDLALHRRNRNKKILKKAVLYVFLTAFTLAVSFPFLWMISSALKTKDEVMNSFSLIPNEFLWGNFVEAFNGAAFGQYIFNSLFTALAIVVIQIVNSAMIAYALTQLQFRGRGALFAVIGAATANSPTSSASVISAATHFFIRPLLHINCVTADSLISRQNYT